MSEEALKSTDPNVLKTARAAVKWKIASAVTSTNILAKDAATGDFDHGLISRTNALSAHDKLVANLELVTKLHELYCVHRERGEDEASEEKLITKD